MSPGVYEVMFVPPLFTGTVPLYVVVIAVAPDPVISPERVIFWLPVKYPPAVAQAFAEVVEKALPWFTERKANAEEVEKALPVVVHAGAPFGFIQNIEPLVEEDTLAKPVEVAA